MAETRFVRFVPLGRSRVDILSSDGKQLGQLRKYGAEPGVPGGWGYLLNDNTQGHRHTTWRLAGAELLRKMNWSAI